jgi:hypothetical protein
MRIRATGIVALWVIAAVVTSAVATCIPGAMAMHGSQMPQCTGHEQPSASFDVPPMDCCAEIAPQVVVSKVELLKAPARSVLLWFTPTTSVALVFVPSSVLPTGSPPGLSTALNPPAYIAFSTLLI